MALAWATGSVRLMSGASFPSVRSGSASQRLISLSLSVLSSTPVAFFFIFVGKSVTIKSLFITASGLSLGNPA